MQSTSTPFISSAVAAAALVFTGTITAETAISYQSRLHIGGQAFDGSVATALIISIQ